MIRSYGHGQLIYYVGCRRYIIFIFSLECLYYNMLCSNHSSVFRNLYSPRVHTTAATKTLKKLRQRRALVSRLSRRTSRLPIETRIKVRRLLIYLKPSSRFYIYTYQTGAHSFDYYRKVRHCCIFTTLPFTISLGRHEI